MDCNLGQNSKTRKVYNYDQRFFVHFSSKGGRFEPTIVCYNMEGHVLEVRKDRQTDRQTASTTHHVNVYTCTCRYAGDSRLSVVLPSTLPVDGISDPG